MEDLRRDVISYVHRFVEERLADDPNRLTAFRNLAQHFHNNRNYNYTQRIEMIREMFGEHNQDLTQVYFPVVQEQYEQVLRLDPPQVQYPRLLKLARICYSLQFMHLYRTLWLPVWTEAYQMSCNGVELFIAGRIPEPQLCYYFSEVFRQFPGFRDQFEARVNRLTSLFRAGGGGGNGYNPGAESPPPQD